MHTHIQQDLAPSSWLWLPPFPKPKDNLGCNVARRTHRHDIHNPEEAAWVLLVYLPCLDIPGQSGRTDYFRGKQKVGERDSQSASYSVPTASGQLNWWLKTYRLADFALVS